MHLHFCTHRQYPTVDSVHAVFSRPFSLKILKIQLVISLTINTKTGVSLWRQENVYTKTEVMAIVMAAA